MKSKILIIITVLLMFSLLACNKKDGIESKEANLFDNDVNTMNVPDVLARVNETIISKEDYLKTYSQLKSSYENAGMDFASLEGLAFLDILREDAIQQLIQEVLLKEATKKAGIDVSDQAALKEIEDYKSQFESIQAFDAALLNMQLNEDDLLAIYKSELAINVYLDIHLEEITISDKDLKTKYDDYVLYLIKTGADEIPDYNLVKDTFKEEVLKNLKQEQLDLFIKDLMDKSNIQINY